MQSTSVRKVLAILPGADVEYGASVLQDREDALAQRADRLGVSLDRRAVQQAVDSGTIVPQYLYNAIEAALNLLENDVTRAVKCLRSCWGREQTKALDLAFGTADLSPVLSDTTAVCEAAKNTFRHLMDSAYSYQRTIAQGHLAHHIGKATGEQLYDGSVRRRQKGLRHEKAGFFLRSSYMGVLRQTDDLDLAARYSEFVSQNQFAHVMELWAFPSWTGDLPPSESFSVPRGLPLSRTAAEVVTEIASYNEAYVWYLATTYIPRALEEVDPTFGHSVPRLVSSLRSRADTCQLEDVRNACLGLCRDLEYHLETT
jgi:hypothetical protein